MQKSQPDNSQQPQAQQPSSPISSTQYIISLLQFQEKFIQLIHTELYNFTNNNDTVNNSAMNQVSQDAIVRFQINYLSEYNDIWRKMIDDLIFKLIKQKIEYESALRDQFHKIINVDFMVFLRVNRHDLTQVSLYGFDIYVDPLSAVLEIINRIDGLYQHNLVKFEVVEQQKQKGKQKIQDKEGQEWHQKPKDIWQAVKQGWNSLIYQSTLYKISLNIYILKQYLKIAGKSLLKRDKQIIFTGCCNIFTQIIPKLKISKQLWLISQFAQLNNQLYYFHQNFNYSHIYSLLFPLSKKYQPIFRNMKIIAQKCYNAQLLTPFLLAILRHREYFHRFIQEADDECWVPYLNGIVFVLIYNFKIKILEYEEAMEILIGAILKLGVFGQLDVGYFMGEVEKEWREARDFFISALKTGYNVGQLQMWHATDYQNIQQRIINCTRDSLLMHIEIPQNIPVQIYFANGFQNQLQACLHEIAGSLLNKKYLTSNFIPNIAQAVIVNQSTIYSILRLANLLKICKLMDNINCICYVISLLNKVGYVESQVLRKRFQMIGDMFCEAGIRKVEKQQKGCQDLKEVLFTYIRKNKPIFKIKEIVNVCLLISAPRDATIEILSIIESQPSILENCPQLPQLIAANILCRYSEQKPTSTPTTIVKTFQKQYTIQQQVLNLNNSLHSCMNILIEHTIQNNSKLSLDIIIWLIRLQNWMVIPLLNFPISSTLYKYDRNDINKKLESFGIWLITHTDKYDILLELLTLGMVIKKQHVRVFFLEISLVTVCDQIVMEINRVLNQLVQIEDNMQFRYIIKLLQFFVIIYPATTAQMPTSTSSQNIIKPVSTPVTSSPTKTLTSVPSSKTLQNSQNSHLNTQLLRKIIKLYQRSLQKLDTILLNNPNQQITLQIIASIFELYCPLLDLIFEDPQLCRNWRIYMRKLCLTSLDMSHMGMGGGMENVYNLREYQLSSIRKDKGFIIHNSVGFVNGGQGGKGGSVGGNKGGNYRMEKFMSQARKYQMPCVFRLSYEVYQGKQYRLSADEIRNFQLSQNPSSSFSSSAQNIQKYLLNLTPYNKQYLLPPLSINLLTQLFKNCSQNSTLLLTDLLSMTPSNHHKLTQYSITTNNKTILTKISLSKQTVQNQFYELIEMLQKDQTHILMENIDQNCKYNICDNFNLMLVVVRIRQDIERDMQAEKQAEKLKQKQKMKIKQLLIKLSRSLNFLIIYNQSNWRYFNELINQYSSSIGSRSISTSKSSSASSLSSHTSSVSTSICISNIPSLLLQYLEYIKITKRENQDYQWKLEEYLELVQAYVRLLEGKLGYIRSMGQSKSKNGNGSAGGSGSMSKNKSSNNNTNSSMSGNKDQSKNNEGITEQQIKLFKINQLSYIRGFCQGWNIKEYLYRVAYLRNQINNINMSSSSTSPTSTSQTNTNFNKLLTIIDATITQILKINLIINKISQGYILCPDFISSFCMDSQTAYNSHKLTLGQHLQSYYKNIGMNPLEIYCYNVSDETMAINIMEFLTNNIGIQNNKIKNLTDVFSTGVGVCVEIKNKNQYNVKKIINEKYHALEKYLIGRRGIRVQGEIVEVCHFQENQNQKNEGKNDNQGVQQNMGISLKLALFYYGLLYNAMLKTNQTKLKLDKITNQTVQRRPISWQFLKPINPQSYHYIKSILIDQQIQKRKIKFVYLEKQLIPHGLNLQVSKFNKEKYCNLIAKSVIGEENFGRMAAFGQGYWSVL